MTAQTCACAHCSEAQTQQQADPASLELGTTIHSAFAFRRSARHSLERTVLRRVRWLLNKVLYLTFVWSSFVLSADEGAPLLDRFASPLSIVFAGTLGLVAELVDPAAACGVLDDEFDRFDGANSVERLDTRYLVLWHVVLSVASVFGSFILDHPWTGMHVYMGTLTVFIMFYPVRMSLLGISAETSFEAFVSMLCHIILGMIFSASFAIFLAFVNVGISEGGAIQEGFVTAVGKGTAVFM